MQVNVFQCPSCSSWIVIPPLDTQSPQAKTCGNPHCGATFTFTSNELQTREVSENLARRGYFFGGKRVITKHSKAAAAHGNLG